MNEGHTVSNGGDASAIDGMLSLPTEGTPSLPLVEWMPLEEMTIERMPPEDRPPRPEKRSQEGMLLRMKGEEGGSTDGWG